MICITVQLLFNQIHIKWFHYAFLFIKHTFTYIKGEDMGSSRRDVSRVLVTSISERVPFYTTADFIIILWNQCTKIWSYHRMILFTQRRKYIYKGQKQTKSDKKGHQRPNAVTFPLSIIIWLCKIHYILKFLIYICLVRHSEIYYFQKPPQKSKVANFYKNIEIVRCERPNKRLKTAIHGSRYDSNGVSMQQQVIYKVSDVRINDEINEQRFSKKDRTCTISVITSSSRLDKS